MTFERSRPTTPATRKGGDHEALVVDDPHEAAGGQMVDADRILEFRYSRTDDEHGLQSPAAFLIARAKGNTHSMLCRLKIGDCRPRSGCRRGNLLKILAVGAAEAGAEAAPMFSPSGVATAMSEMKPGSRALSSDSSASFAAVSAGVTPMTWLTPSVRLSRLPR